MIFQAAPFILPCAIMSIIKKKKAQPARPKLQKPAPKKRTPAQRKSDQTATVRSLATPPEPTTAKGKYHSLLHGALWSLVFLVAGYLTLSLCTFSVEDPSFIRGIPNTVPVSNGGGLIGAYLADIGYYMLGLSVWWLVVAACVWLYKNFRMFNIERELYSPLLAGLGLGIILFSSPMLERMMLGGKLTTTLFKDAGGVVGELVTTGFTMYLGHGGSIFILIMLLAVGLKLLVQFSYQDLVLQLAEKAKQQWAMMLERSQTSTETHTRSRDETAETEPSRWQAFSNRISTAVQEQWQKWTKKRTQPVDDVINHTEPSVVSADEPQANQPKKKAKPFAIFQNDEEIEHIPEIVDEETSDSEQDETGYRLPSLNLLTQSDAKPLVVDEKELERVGELIKAKLAEFSIKVEVPGAIPGPVITRYELQLAKGVKGSQIKNLAKDLARSLAIQSVRIVETIPGKNTMGIELPNDERQDVLLYDILHSPVFTHAESKLSIALGKDIAGTPIIGDLARMPHLLVGGMTGSGKSVGVNAMIMSILFKAKPEEVRFIMIDPKMLELSVYEGIPHLLCPVVTDMKSAGNALNWCVAEMEKRYRLLSHIGVRSLAGFNQKIRTAQQNGESIANPFSLNPDEPEPLETLPQIVVVIDELADLMMTERKAVETQIARLAQKARAAGIHMIIATQRPSVDVITGLIKANVPTRMAFTVQSKIDSRTILDQMGAEDLLRNGDLLFLQPGNAEPIRLQGAFVSDDEVHRVVEAVKKQGEPNYVEGLLTGEAMLETRHLIAPESAYENRDELFQKAVDFVLSSRKTSISSLQRGLRIGYNRASNLMDSLEQEGIVSPAESNGTRRILVTREHLR